MNRVPRPDEKMLLATFSGQKPAVYNTLSRLIHEDLGRRSKKNHWIWYMYPQSREAVRGTGANYEYTDVSTFYAVFFSDDYQTLFRKVNRKPLEWFSEIDRMRVSHFRAANADLVGPSTTETRGKFTDCAK